MRHKLIITGLLALILLAACGTPGATPPATPTQAAAVASTSAPTAAPAPTQATAAATIRVSGTGEVRAARTANLAFPVGGKVAEVRIKEGDTVQAEQVLAVLDVRPLDAQLQQAEAGLALAQAQAAALNDPPSAAEVCAARAEIQRAEIGLAQARSGQNQDARTADSTLAAAQANLQQTRDQLSAAKNNAQLQIEQGANQLRNAQDEYSRVYWDNRNLEKQFNQFGKELPQENKDAEAAALRAVQSAEKALEQAKLAYEQAQNNERTGIQAAEEQVAQAQVGRERANAPQGQDQVAVAQAQLEAAQAGLARLQPAPRPGQKAQAAATIAQAEATLSQVKLNREQAELRAPFAGVVTALRVQAGETAGADAVITLLDVSILRFEAPVADVDIAQVRLVQRAQIQLDALPGERFTGIVSYIAPASVTQGNVRTYLVRVDLSDAQRVRVGMSGQLVLETGR